MKMQDVLRSGMAMALVVVCAAGVLPRAQAADTVLPAQAAPSWASQTLGRVWYSYLGDQRKKDDMRTFRLNEDGLITGEDFMNQSRQDSLAGMLYEQLLSSHPEKIDPKKSASQLRMEYHQKIEDSRMAILILNRIIDHEAMKHKLAPEVSDARVDYIMRSILIQVAMKTKKVKAHSVPKKIFVMDEPSEKDPQPRTCHEVAAVKDDGSQRVEYFPDEDVASRSNQELFGWAKQAVGESVFNFGTDWSDGNIGMSFDHDYLHSHGDLGWPAETKTAKYMRKNPKTQASEVQQTFALNSSCAPIQQEQGVSMVFEHMPSDWHAFRESIRAQLQTTYRQFLRLGMWKALIQEHNPLLSWQAMFAVTPGQVDEMYAAFKSSPLIQIPHFVSSIVEVRAEGAQAVDFKKRYLALLDAGEAAHENEFKSVEASATATAEGSAAWMTHISELRSKIQDEAYRQTVSEFGPAILGGKLKATSTSRALERDASDKVPEGTGFSIDEANSAFDMAFFTKRLIARMEGVDSDSSIKIMTMVDLQPKPQYRKIDDERVRAFLKLQVENRVKGKAFRQLAFELFKLNKFEFSYNFCRDLDWPCSYADDPTVAPRLLAEALFPETLYPGLRMPTFLQQSDIFGNSHDAADVPGQPPQARYSSSLNHNEYFDRVQDISIDNLSKVFATSNDHIDYDTQFHND